MFGRPEPKPKNKPGWHFNIKMAHPEMQLRKIANHPYLVKMPTEVDETGANIMVSNEDLVTSSGKMLALNAMLLKLHQRGHKVIYNMPLVLVYTYTVQR